MDLPHRAKRPQIHPSVYVDPTARILGDVTIEEDASIWCCASLRGDVHSIRIGPRSSIQDACAVHCTFEEHAVDVGAEVVVGHGVILHGCTIVGPALIGMGAIVMDGCVVEPDVIVGAGALVTEGKVLPRGHLVLGAPARPVRPLEEQELEAVRNGWKRYVRYVQAYREQGCFRGWEAHPLLE